MMPGNASLIFVTLGVVHLLDVEGGIHIFNNKPATPGEMIAGDQNTYDNGHDSSHDSSTDSGETYSQDGDEFVDQNVLSLEDFIKNITMETVIYKAQCDEKIFYDSWKDTHSAAWPEANSMDDAEKFSICLQFIDEINMPVRVKVIIPKDILKMEVTNIPVTFRKKMFVSEGMIDDNPTIDTQVLLCPMSKVDYEGPVENNDKNDFYLGKWKRNSSNCLAEITEVGNINHCQENKDNQKNKIYYVNQVDHFNFVDNRTFPLRYLINDTYWSKDGPIFFYTGNEGNIEVFAANTGFLWEAAVKFQALVIFAEHRYYGLSMPFGNDSLKNPMHYGYLTSEQALADYVDVIYHVKYNRGTKLKIKKKINPVIVFGGSYGGMLAAWIRMKYPAVVEGALAASAPIWQFSGMTSCFTYNQVLTSSFNASSPVCVQNIRNSWDVIIKEPLAVNYLNSNWNLCKPIMTDEDGAMFLGWLADIYSNLAMTNYPYPTNFLTPLPAYPVKEFCSHLNTKITDNRNLLQSLFRAINVYMNHTGSVKCMDWEEDPAAQLGAAGWNIQACTEMVMPICSNGVTDMFPPETWNLKEYSDICYENFKVRPREFMAEKQYGGKNLDKASNIIFSNGLLDPWSSGGVMHSVSDSTVVVLLPEAAHHLDLRASNPNDPHSVTQARQLYKNVFKRWIREYRKKYRSSYNEYDKYLSTL